MLNFASAPGNTFNRLGKLGLLVKQVKSYQTSQLANMTDTVNGVVAQYNGESDIQALMGSAYISALSLPEGVCNVAAQIAQATVSRMVYRDNPQISQSLQTLNVLTSLQEIIRQMKVQNATVFQMAVTNTPIVVSGQPGPHFTGIGNGVMVSSVRRPKDGLLQENAFAENILLTCTSDSYSSTATAGNEGFSVTGVGQENDFFAFDWPLGSNAQTTLSAVDGNTDNGNGNVLTNSGFNTWVAGVPSNWSITLGGATIFQENTLVYDGSSALRLQGDGATLTSWQQLFNSSTGTLGTLSPLSQYSFCVWMRRDGVAPANGTLQIDLIDGNGNVIQDANGTNNSTTVNLTTLTTSYAPQTFMVRTPYVMPSSYSWRFHLTGTPLTNGRSVYIDKAGLGAMTQVYTSGPYQGVHAGSIPFAIGDYGSSQVSNPRGAAGTLSTFQTLMAQLFQSTMLSNELLLPSSPTPSINDALIG